MTGVLQLLSKTDKVIANAKQLFFLRVDGKKGECLRNCVMPAKAGIQAFLMFILDASFRWHDKLRDDGKNEAYFIIIQFFPLMQ